LSVLINWNFKRAWKQLWFHRSQSCFVIFSSSSRNSSV